MCSDRRAGLHVGQLANLPRLPQLYRAGHGGRRGCLQLCSCLQAGVQSSSSAIDSISRLHLEAQQAIASSTRCSAAMPGKRESQTYNTDHQMHPSVHQSRGGKSYLLRLGHGSSGLGLDGACEHVRGHKGL